MYANSEPSVSTGTSRPQVHGKLRVTPTPSPNPSPAVPCAPALKAGSRPASPSPAPRSAELRPHSLRGSVSDDECNRVRLPGEVFRDPSILPGGWVTSLPSSLTSGR